MPMRYGCPQCPGCRTGTARPAGHLHSPAQLLQVPICPGCGPHAVQLRLASLQPYTQGSELQTPPLHLPLQSQCLPAACT